MRHVVLTTKFRPTPGGIEQYLHGVAAALAERQEDVRVVACGVDPSGGSGPEGRDGGYGLRYVDGVEALFDGRPARALPGVRTLASAALVLRRYAHGRTTIGSLVERRDGTWPRVYVGVWNEIAHGWCAGLRRRGVPYRLFAYGLEVVRSLDPVRDRWRAADFRSAEVVYACSGPTAALVERTFEGAEARAVRPGVPEPADREAVEAAAAVLRRELAIEPDARVLVTVGRLVRRKGVHRVLEALASPGLDAGSVRYLVVGDGPERERLLRRARELGLEKRVDFLGRVDERTKWAAYEVGDLYVMPSDDQGGTDWEGFGIVYLEAAVMGLPSVAGRSGGAREAVRHGRTGYLVEPDAPAELADALRELVGSPETCRRMGEAARAWARSEFTWGRAAERILASS